MRHLLAYKQPKAPAHFKPAFPTNKLFYTVFTGLERGNYISSKTSPFIATFRPPFPKSPGRQNTYYVSPLPPRCDLKKQQMGTFSPTFFF